MNAQQKMGRKRFIWARYQGICQGCGTSLSFKEATLDHIIPKSRGGADGIENLQIMCWSCNQAKDDTMPSDGRGAFKETGPVLPIRVRKTPPPGFEFTGGVFAEWKEKLGM